MSSPDPVVCSADEFLAELLSLMGKILGYDFDKVRIKKGIYIPRGHGNIEFENNIIRRGIVEILSGKKGFPVSQYVPMREKTESKEQRVGSRSHIVQN